MTKELQGNIGENRMNGAIFDVLLCMDFLLQQLETAKETYTDSPILASCINLAWSKLNKYYEATDDSSIYATAAMLVSRAASSHPGPALHSGKALHCDVALHCGAALHCDEMLRGHGNLCEAAGIM
jgi:hypothetical protein